MIRDRRARRQSGVSRDRLRSRPGRDACGAGRAQDRSSTAATDAPSFHCRASSLTDSARNWPSPLRPARRCA